MSKSLASIDVAVVQARISSREEVLQTLTGLRLVVPEV